MENIKKKININLIIAIIFIAIMIALMWVLSYTYSNPAISIKSSSGLDIYVSGAFVESDGDGYSVTQDSEVTITAFNNTKIFESYNITVNDGTSEKPLTDIVTGIDITKPTITFNVKTNYTLNIDAVTSAVNPAEKGTSFSNAYLLRDHAECKAMYIIYEADTTAPDFNESNYTQYLDMFGFDNVADAQTLIQKAYIKVTTNILLDSEEFYGIGNERLPFRGKIDFSSNVIYLNLRNSNYTDRFGADKIFNSGFFGMIEATDDEPVIIRNMNINGSVFFKNDSGSDKILNTGTIAGSSKGNVIYQNIKNSVSASIHDTCSLNVGAGFGILSSPLQKWSNYEFSGKFVTIDATTTGEGCDVNVGGLAAILSDTYCMNLNTNTLNCSLIGNSLGNKSGNCNVGGVFGLIRNTGYDNMYIDGITLQPQEEFHIVSTINNSDTSLNQYEEKNAIAGGVIGNFDNQTGAIISIGSMVYNSINAEKTSLKIEALTSTENSKGNVCAGGLIGYIPYDNGTIDVKQYNFANDLVIFNVNTEILAINNGYGEAYAGGMYGYNSPNSTSLPKDTKVNINLNTEKNSIVVKAIQASTSKSFDENDLNALAVGFLTAIFPSNKIVSNLQFNVFNGELKAIREIGALCAGPIFVGGFAGGANGDNTADVAIKDITVNFTNTEIAALGLSFDSISITDSNTNKYYNNLCVGGFIGYVENYGTNELAINSDDSFTVSNNPGIENINIIINNSEEYENSFVKGTFNAKSGAVIGSTQKGMDNVTEAYVGGIIGHANNAFMKNLNIKAVKEKAIIEYSCEYDPNTSAVGGILGSTHLYNDFGLDGGTVENLIIEGKAHFNPENDPGYNAYDLYAGGAVGVGGFNGYKCLFKNIFVYDSEIRAFGENQMITYAGGIVGGLWWNGTGIIYNCGVFDSDIISQANNINAYSGGISGLIQTQKVFNNIPTKIVSSYCINSNIFASSQYASATSAGIVSQQKYQLLGDTISYVVKSCINTSIVYAKGINSNIYPISPAVINSNISGNDNNNYYDPYKILNGKTNTNQNTGDNFDIVDYNTILALYNTGVDSSNNVDVYSSYSITNENASNKFTIYNNYSNYNSNSLAKLSVALSDNDIVTLSENNLCTPKTTAEISVDKGMTYGQLKLKINSLNKEFVICSYPIFRDTMNLNYILNPTSADNITLDSSNFSSYVEDYKINAKANNLKDEYIQLKIGKSYAEPLYSQGIIINFGSYDIPCFQLHNANSAIDSINENVFTQALTVNNPLGHYSLSHNVQIKYLDKKIGIIPNNLLNERQIIKLSFFDTAGNTNNLILDIIPNYINDLALSIASEDTPYLYKDETDINNPIYIFSHTDIAIIKADEIHNYPWFDKSNVNFTLVGTVTGVDVNSNGMVRITDVADGTEFTVKATYVGNIKADSNTISKTITLRISKEILLETELIGAKFTTTRKLVKSYPFEFTVSPLHGYGYAPTIHIDIDGISYDFNLPDCKEDITTPTELVKNHSTYTYNHADGSYTIIINKNAMDGDYKKITMRVEFPAVYNLIFDFGPLFEKLNNNDKRYYVHKVKTGTVIDNTLVEEIKADINKSILNTTPYGFECKGFYLTERADTLNGYGTKFYDIGNLEDKWQVYAPIYFYARWTYDIIVDAPDMVTVESHFPIGLIEENDSQDLHIVPINALHGMKFSLKIDEKFEGIPDFDMYIIEKNADETFSYNLITDKCILSEDKSYYTIDPMEITGLLYLRVYPDNMLINGIVDDKIEFIDKNILDNGELFIRYAVNYKLDGIPIADAVINNVSTTDNGIKLDFTVASNHAITIGTTIRLYHHINKTPVGEYEYVATESSNSVCLKDFKNTSTRKSILEDRYNYSGSVYSETYYFIVSYPLDSDNQHKPTAGYTKVTAESNIICNMLTTYEGSFSEDYANTVVFNNRPYEKVDNDYTIYNGAVLICTNTTEKINITWTFNGLGQVAKNYRFLDNIMIWSIKKDGLFTDDEKAAIIAKFKNPILITGNALYYNANLNPDAANPNIYSLSLDIKDISSSYEISLSITRTPKTPAAAIKLWSNK